MKIFFYSNFHLKIFKNKIGHTKTESDNEVSEFVFEYFLMKIFIQIFIQKYSKTELDYGKKID